MDHGEQTAAMRDYQSSPARAQYVSLAYNMPSWFVSALAGCWLLEHATCRLAALIAAQHRPLLLSTTALCAWVLAWPFARCPLTWGVTSWNTIDGLSFVHMYASGAGLSHAHAVFPGGAR